MQLEASVIHAEQTNQVSDYLADEDTLCWCDLTDKRFNSFFLSCFEGD